MNAEMNVLLASHGTQGAMAAEQAAIDNCKKGDHLHHLLVVPTLWQGMTGDDWLNNGVTRDRYRRYIESELSKEVEETVSRVKQKAEQHDLIYTQQVVVGEPEDCLLDASNKEEYNLIVMGSHRPKGESGLRSRMLTKKLTRKLTTPIKMVPHPNE